MAAGPSRSWADAASTQDGELATSPARQSPTVAGASSGRAWRARRQQGDPLVLVEAGVVVVHAAGSQQLGDDLLVHHRVLAQVERAQVEPEHVDGATEPGEAIVGECAGAVRPQRAVDDGEVGASSWAAS